MDRPARGRFAPSPTGVMHLGNVWTALLAWLAARHAGGAMVLRMEDLDPDRSRPEFAARIMADLAWLGLDWDEGPDRGGPYAPYDQDSRRHLYGAALDRLAARDLVYPCLCTRAELRAAASAPHLGQDEPAYPGTCRDRPHALNRPGGPGGPGGKSDTAACPSDRPARRPALRLRVPEGAVETFVDGRRGPVSQDVGRASGDFVLRRADGVHAYQLAVVVDDAAMAITQVVRSDDLLDSTPRQLLLYRLLGLSAPAFAHVPLLVDPAGVRLSKRQQSLGLDAIRARGRRPEEIVGFLAWKAGLRDGPRPVRAAELVDGFSFAALPPDAVAIGDDDLA